MGRKSIPNQGSLQSIYWKEYHQVSYKILVYGRREGRIFQTWDKVRVLKLILTYKEQIEVEESQSLV